MKRKIKIRTFPDLLPDLQIGRTRIRLLHPSLRAIEDLEGNLNETSLVLEISFGETRVILPGDAGRTAEELIIPDLGAG